MSNDWAEGCPDQLVTSFLGVLVGYLSMRLVLNSVIWVKKIALICTGRHHPICEGPEYNKEVEEGRIA
jgi:hypothetical protein